MMDEGDPQASKPLILCHHFDEETERCALNRTVPDDCYGNGAPTITCACYVDVNAAAFLTIEDKAAHHDRLARGYRHAADRLTHSIEAFKRDMDVQVAGLFLHHSDEERLLTIVHKCKLELQQIPLSVHALAAQIEQS